MDDIFNHATCSVLFSFNQDNISFSTQRPQIKTNSDSKPITDLKLLTRRALLYIGICLKYPSPDKCGFRESRRGCTKNTPIYLSQVKSWIDLGSYTEHIQILASAGWEHCLTPERSRRDCYSLAEEREHEEQLNWRCYQCFNAGPDCLFLFCDVVCHANFFTDLIL